MSTPSSTLHYVFDPLCGWCYAAAPLIQAARAVPGLSVQWHGGGMLSGPMRRTITPDWRAHVLPHDRRIAEMTGQPFGEAYFEGLLRDVGAPLDSSPPITAMLAAEAVDGRGLDMLARMQKAHYVEGRRIGEPAVLGALAQDLGLDAQAFEARCAALAGAATDAHIQESRRWLGRLGGQGFPTLGLQHADGRLTPINMGLWLGRPDAWQAMLAQATMQA